MIRKSWFGLGSLLLLVMACAPVDESGEAVERTAEEEAALATACEELPTTPTPAPGPQVAEAAAALGLEDAEELVAVCAERIKCDSKGHTCASGQKCCYDLFGEFYNCVSQGQNCMQH